ncbi:uncharacterized protein [Hyperolius riggenbachi]|uniref:uncharacterized protein n=1 Tax=Hyperolius riggenbachi TaxID=752182 RepID=UPI0035A2F259
MAYFLQQSNYHYTGMSAKNLLLELNYPTPPYMYLREILRIPTAKPPCVRPRLLMDMTIKYIPRQGGGYEVQAGQGFGGSGTCTLTQPAKISLCDKEKKAIVSISNENLAAQHLKKFENSKKAKFEYIWYTNTSFGDDLLPIRLKLGDAYLSCNENGELTLEKPNESEDLCDITGGASKYVFLRSKIGYYSKFQSAIFQDKCICTIDKDSSPLALARCDDNTKISEFVEEEEPQKEIEGSSLYTRSLAGGAGITTEATVRPYASLSLVLEAERVNAPTGARLSVSAIGARVTSLS